MGSKIWAEEEEGEGQASSKVAQARSGLENAVEKQRNFFF